MKRGRGAPTKLTKQVIADVAHHIYPVGNYFSTACELAGIGATTGYNWLAMAEGRKRRSPGVPEDLLIEFLKAVKDSESRVENAAVLAWRTAFDNDWRSVAEYLSRRFPERWRKTERQEVEFTIDWEKLTDDQLKRIADGENPLIVIGLSSQGKA